MHKITLVCSGHRKNGLCNADELLKILRAIEPEVIFVEVRPEDMDSYSKTRWSLEAQAIEKYREFKSFRSVPVDHYDVPAHLLVELKRDVDRVFDYVERASQEYRLLEEENDRCVPQHGFRYLNSAAFETRTARMAEIEEETIMRTGDRDLNRALERWRQDNQSRELAMVRNVYEYCGKNVFGAGIFLVGAAHKKGIAKEIEKYAGTEAARIDWSFAYGG